MGDHVLGFLMLVADALNQGVEAVGRLLRAVQGVHLHHRVVVGSEFNRFHYSVLVTRAEGTVRAFATFAIAHHLALGNISLIGVPNG